jgi:hypothetical protein
MTTTADNREKVELSSSSSGHQIASCNIQQSCREFGKPIWIPYVHANGDCLEQVHQKLGRKKERKKERKAGGLDWKVYSLHARVSKVSEKKSG